MEGLEVAVVLGLTVLAGGLANRYLRVPAPWAWLAVGIIVSFVPGVPEVALPPDIVLYIFLPALLYWESLNISVHGFRFDLRVISLLSIGLVFVTAAAVAGIGTLMGLAFPVALVLGAVLSPTDATAVSAMAPRLPRRIDTMLRGESLVNDASALALYSVAVAAVVAGRDPSIGEISLSFVWAVVIGVALGLAAGYALYLLRRIARTPSLAATVSVITPFVLYLPAEMAHGSGVVAVVAGGLLLSLLLPRVVSANARTLSFDFWRVASYVINGALFVLIGLQAHSVVETYATDGWLSVLLLTLAVTVAIFAVRFLWVVAMAPAIRLLDRRPSQRDRRVPFRIRAILIGGGFRGAVSLAAALSVPALIADGMGFPDRQLLVAVTFGVIVLLLVGQGAAMPLILKRAHLPHDDGSSEEYRLAVTTMAHEALDHLDADAAAAGASPEAQRIVRERIDETLAKAGDLTDREADAAVRALLLTAISRKRHAIEQLRASGRIDDLVFLRVQGDLDHEELRLHTERE
ncbi:Na+/H+ antiporter [Herbiconiux ginsengi]|uniref:Sodium/proton antiporter, CPA1 family n=1 Tax=Herbiconiux ginsengi TaxID=381665 RepID=A0A1H3S1I4_9MICO|nr:Na+/H+ antiporter [Herbiconiux ginsengi]SDZ31866.1 sodium/proton antiporter, CPA1 family [Herbiconiux ginsengi]